MSFIKFKFFPVHTFLNVSHGPLCVCMRTSRLPFPYMVECYCLRRELRPCSSSFFHYKQRFLMWTIFPFNLWLLPVLCCLSAESMAYSRHLVHAHRMHLQKTIAYSCCLQSSIDSMARNAPASLYSHLIRFFFLLMLLLLFKSNFIIIILIIYYKYCSIIDRREKRKENKHKTHRWWTLEWLVRSTDMHRRSHREIMVFVVPRGVQCRPIEC